MSDTPVTTAEAKLWCRIDTTDDDTLVTNLIEAASDYILNVYGIACELGSHPLYYDCFAARMPLYRTPLASVTAVNYTSSGGVDTVLASDQYRLRRHLGVPVLQPAYGVAWPATERVDGAVTVTVSAGYANNAAVPEAIRTAALMLVAHWYENRGAVLIGLVSKALELTVDDLLRPYRMLVIA